MPVVSSGAEVAVQRLDGVHAQRQRTLTPALAEDVSGAQVEIEVGQLEVGHLGQTSPESMNSVISAASRRSSKPRPLQVSSSRRSASGGTTATLFSSIFGMRILAIEEVGISPSSSSQPKNCFSRWRVAAVDDDHVASKRRYTPPRARA